MVGSSVWGWHGTILLALVIVQGCSDSPWLRFRAVGIGFGISPRVKKIRDLSLEFRSCSLIGLTIDSSFFNFNNQTNFTVCHVFPVRQASSHASLRKAKVYDHSGSVAKHF